MSMSQRLKVGVIFGGRSAEHEVSLVSATGVINALDPAKYEVVPIGITPEGRWLSAAHTLQLLKDKSPLQALPEHVLVPDPTKHGLVLLANGTSAAENGRQLDVVIPLVHGTFGEDGTLQGLLELADLPYVGAGVLGSAVGMDKVIQKELLRQAGVTVTPSVWFLGSSYAASPRKHVAAAEKKLGYPMFVKPPNAGSSIGITKAHNRAELMAGIELAATYDRKVLVELAVKNAREIEVSVLGNDAPEASIPGEIIPSNEFYDYDAKYVDGKSRAEIPARLPKPVIRKVQSMAVAGFKALDCAGMARVDFLVSRRTNRVYLNEINTIPGFTPISMYPKLWAASGLSYPRLLDRLIELALSRHKEKEHLATQFKPKSDWYR